VGKRRLERALALLPPALASAVSVRWRPFFLDASLPREGVDKLARYVEKFGAARVRDILPHMAAVGAAEGIAFDYGGRMSNTLASHVLIEAAWGAGGAPTQAAVVEALFSYYFERLTKLKFNLKKIKERFF
jgi:predicted DsbA family dithiol-disulfide isomerase